RPAKIRNALSRALCRVSDYAEASVNCGDKSQSHPNLLGIICILQDIAVGGRIMLVIGQRGSGPKGPLVPCIDAFKQRSVALGYAPTTVRMQAPLISGFSKWLGQKKIALENVSSDHAEHYLQYRKRHRRGRSDDSATLRRLLGLL